MGVLALLVIQFGWHETRLRDVEATSKDHGALISKVAAATDERRDGMERTITRLETAGIKQSDAIADLRDVVVELRAAMAERRRR